MFESILAYIIMLLPSIFGLFGGIATVVCNVNKIRKSNAETQAVIADAKQAVATIQSSPQLQEMLTTIVKENVSLKKTLTLCHEELTRIHKLHPEWIEEDGETNGKE